MLLCCILQAVLGDLAAAAVPWEQSTTQQQLSQGLRHTQKSSNQRYGPAALPAAQQTARGRQLPQAQHSGSISSRLTTAAAADLRCGKQQQQLQQQQPPPRGRSTMQARQPVSQDDETCTEFPQVWSPAFHLQQGFQYSRYSTLLDYFQLLFCKHILFSSRL